MSLAPGTRLGPYEITTPIGEGGMGKVYRARDTTLGRDVAIKVLPDAFAADPDRLARFEREAKTLASLNHPNIAAIYGFERFPGTKDPGLQPDGAPGLQPRGRALVMEFVDGQDLSQRIARGAIPVDDALAIAKQIADALEAAHEQGVVHRDLKPANVKVRADGVVKVLDFGLAKALGAAGAEDSGLHADAMNSPTLTSPAMTRAGMILGTAAYMAPEQARGRIVDRRADIWAFGVVLFEMLTGRRAFAGDDVTDTIVSVVSKEPDWTALPVGTPTGLRRLMADCLKKDPKARLRDIGDARIQIEDLLAGGKSHDGVAAPHDPRTTPAARRQSALPWILAAVTTASTIAVLLSWAPWRAAPSPTPDWGFARTTYVNQAIFNARFMHDGETVVFSAALAGNKPSLFEMRPKSTVQRAFGPPNAHLLAVSRSGELAILTNTQFLGHRIFSGTLARMTLDGAPRALAEDVREADWLPDGLDLAVIRDVPAGDQLEFPIGHIVHRTSGYLSDLRVSPDGTRVAFMEHPVKFDDRGWVKVVDRAGAAITLAGEYSGEDGVAWSADSRTVYFAPNGSRILSVDASGATKPAPVLGIAGTVIIYDIAPDGRLLLNREDTSARVVARGAAQAGDRDLSTIGSEWVPTLSPHGDSVAFTQSGGPDYVVMLRSTDGSPPAQLGPGNAGPFSPDGKWVTANLFSKGQCVVYPTGAGSAVPVIPGPLQSCTGAAWFPDGKHLLLLGNEAGKPPRLYRAAFPGGTPELLPLPANLALHISTASCLMAMDPSGVWTRFDTTGRVVGAIAGLGKDDTLLTCVAGGKTAIVADDRAIPAVLFRVDLGSGQRTKIAEVAPADRSGLLRVFMTHYRENDQYAYWYIRSISTLYLATQAK